MVRICRIERSAGALADDVDMVAAPVCGDPEAGSEPRGATDLWQPQLPKRAAHAVCDLHGSPLVSSLHKDGEAPACRAFGQRDAVALTQASAHYCSNVGANLVAGLGIPCRVERSELIDAAVQHGMNAAVQCAVSCGPVSRLGQHRGLEQVGKRIVLHCSARVEPAPREHMSGPRSQPRAQRAAANSSGTAIPIVTPRYPFATFVIAQESDVYHFKEP